MFRRIGFTLVTLAMTVLVAPSAWADVIAARQAGSGADSERVQQRLVEIGMSSEKASGLAASLTAEELAFFASDPQSMQAVGGLWAEEWIISLALVAAMGATAYLAVTNVD